MYPCIDKINKLVDIPDEYLGIVAPIVGEQAISLCGCEIETENTYPIIAVETQAVKVSGEVKLGKYSYVLIDKKYCITDVVFGIDPISGDVAETTFTLDEKSSNVSIGDTLIELDIPDGLMLPIANEIKRNKLNGVTAESVGNASISYSGDLTSNLAKEVGSVVGCENSSQKGMVFI